MLKFHTIHEQTFCEAYVIQSLQGSTFRKSSRGTLMPIPALMLGRQRS